ncbi:MAG: hypothetical protein WBD67_05605 [Terracidiphilus sp.]
MSQGPRNDSYNAALNTAVMELNQIAAELELLQRRKGSLQMASDGLKALLASPEQSFQVELRPHSPSPATEPRVVEFPAGEGAPSGESRHASSIQQRSNESTDPLQQRIYSALGSAANL